MVYVDTSIIVKLYFREKYTLEASNWLKRNDEAIPLTSFHELELINAIYLKQFRKEIDPDCTRKTISLFKDHEKLGVFYRPPINWSDIFIYSIQLSNSHTEKIGSRSLDILHVASALSIKADKFLTLNKRQAALASTVNLKVETLH